MHFVVRFRHKLVATDGRVKRCVRSLEQERLIGKRDLLVDAALRSGVLLILGGSGVLSISGGGCATRKLSAVGGHESRLQGRRLGNPVASRLTTYEKDTQNI